MFGGLGHPVICVLLNDIDFESEVSPLETSLEKLSIRYDCWRTFTDGFPETLSGYDGLIVSGGFTMAGYFEKTEELIGARLVREFSNPVLGICLGMQILARLEGVSLVSSSELGVTRVSLEPKNRLFQGMGRDLECYQRHNYGLPYVPRGYSLIARGSSTFIQGIAALNTPRFAVQFHPEEIELGSAIESLKIFANFREIVDEWSTCRKNRM